MKKKLTKKQRKDLDQLINMLIIGVFLLTFYFTDSWKIGLAAGAFTFGIILGTQLLLKQKKTERLKKSGIREIDQMDGFQFEHYLYELFKSNGYKAKITKARGDFGADLILQKDGESIAVQAKRYSKPVGIKAVQEIAAAKSHYNADQAWVVSNNSFTKQAEQMAQSTNVRLIDREKLISLVLNMNPNANQVAHETLATVEAKVIRCNQCGGKMSVKKGKHGNFYGCNNFPRCKNTKKL